MPNIIPQEQDFEEFIFQSAFGPATTLISGGNKKGKGKGLGEVLDKGGNPEAGTDLKADDFFSFNPNDPADIKSLGLDLGTPDFENELADSLLRGQLHPKQSAFLQVLTSLVPGAGLLKGANFLGNKISGGPSFNDPVAAVKLQLLEALKAAGTTANREGEGAALANNRVQQIINETTPLDTSRDIEIALQEIGISAEALGLT